MRLSTILFLLGFAPLPSLFGQSFLEGFESFDVPLDSFIAEAPNGEFASPPLRFPNSFNAAFNSFDGWAMSSKTDTVTPGFGNQFSAITGQGADNSLTYAVGYPPFDGQLIIRRDGAAVDRQFRDLRITNTTYAYRSMLEGDDFAKQFGGPSGDDPDFFSVVFKAYKGGELLADSLEFFLADYRFDDNSLDYIIDTWTPVKLNDVFTEPVDSLWISFRSSDVGAFGINTPTYLAIDNVRLDPFVSTVRPTLLPAPYVYPNPGPGLLTIRDIRPGTSLRVLDVYGREIRRVVVRSRLHQLDLTTAAAGVYWLRAAGHEAVRVVLQPAR